MVPSQLPQPVPIPFHSKIIAKTKVAQVSGEKVVWLYGAGVVFPWSLCCAGLDNEDLEATLENELGPLYLRGKWETAVEMGAHVGPLPS